MMRYNQIYDLHFYLPFLTTLLEDLYHELLQLVYMYMFNIHNTILQTADPARRPQPLTCVHSITSLHM